MGWFLTQFFWYCSTALEVLLCFRLVSSGTWRLYPRFTLFIGALATESIVLAAVLPRSHDLYGNVWIFTRASALLLEVLAVIEIFSRSASNFPGIQSIGRKLLLTLFGGALLLTVATLPADRNWSGWKRAFQITSVVNRQTHLCLAVFLLLMLAFFAFYGAPVAANLRRHTWAMFAFLMATASSYLIVTRSHAFWLSSIALPAVSLLSLVAWFSAFRPGENIRVRPVLTQEDVRESRAAEALNQRLVVLNQRITLRTLLGLAPKARPSGD